MKKPFDSYFYKTFFRLFSVVAFQSLIVFSVNLADSLMLGSYDETAMSGVSLANQIQFLLQCLINGVCNGLVVIGSQYWGKRQTEPIKKVYAAALWTGLAVSGVLGAAVLLFPEGVLGVLSSETEIVAAGAAYIRIMGWTYPVFTIVFLLTSLMRSVETIRIGFITSLLALAVNISLNWLLIFGKWGFPELGAVGAAWATFAARAAELAAASVYVFAVDKKIRLKPKDAFHIEKDYVKDYLKTGLPMIGSGGSWGVAMSVQTAIIGRLGAAAIGANAIAAPVFQVVAVLYGSSGTASGVLIGKTVGEDDIPRVKRYVKKLQVMYLIVGVLSAGLLLLLKSSILGIYSVTEETRALAATFINILAVTVVGSAYEAPCLVGIVSGGGDTRFVLINDLIFMWGLVLPLSALSAFVFRWSIPVTFFILKADQIAKCAVAVIKVNRFRWIRQLTR